MDIEDRYLGAMYGLACGDALGTTLEFSRRDAGAPVTEIIGGGPFHLKPGEWTDDTSMALCLAESIIQSSGFNAKDQLERYCDWQATGHLSSNGRCFDIGGTCSVALSDFRLSRTLRRRENASEAGNGALMRLAPIPLAFARQPARAIEYAATMTKTTHGARSAADASMVYTAMILGALAGKHKNVILDPVWVEALLPRGHRLCSEISEVVRSAQYKTRDEVRGSGHVVRALEAAIWAFATTGTFREGACLAVNLGEDADTTGAIYGQLAGAYYAGHPFHSIPPIWIKTLALRETIEIFARQLYHFAQSLQ